MQYYRHLAAAMVDDALIKFLYKIVKLQKWVRKLYNVIPIAYHE